MHLNGRRKHRTQSSVGKYGRLKRGMAALPMGLTLLMSTVACTQAGVERGVYERLNFRHCVQVDNAWGDGCTPRSYESYSRARARAVDKPAPEDRNRSR